VEDQEHVGFGSRGLVLGGKKPEIQLCVQADAGSGSWLNPSLRPARLNTALAFILPLRARNLRVVKECAEITLGQDCRVARDCGSVGGRALGRAAFVRLSLSASPVGSFVQGLSPTGRIAGVGGRVPLSLRAVVGIAGIVRQGCRAWHGGSLAGHSQWLPPPRACGRSVQRRMLGWGMRMKS
jgi:hypothetical protein